MKLGRTLAALAALALLSACILVEDFSAMWDKGETDPCVSKIAESLYYAEFRRDPEGKDMSKHAHIFSVGKYHFLMLKQDEGDAGGRMYRFGVINGIFQRFRLDPVMREAFKIEFPDAPVSFRHDTVTLKQLGDAEMKILTEISSRDDYWEIEDQTLYNVMLNPLCKYEDRDIKAMKAEDEAPAPKPKKAKHND